MFQLRTGVLPLVAIGLVICAAGLAIPAQSALASPAQPVRNLLKDGDFAAAPNPGSFTTYAKGSTAITGWTVTKATVDLIGTLWAAPGGRRSVDLDGTPGFGAIAQTFATSTGRKYVVSFLLSGNAAQGPTIKRMRVKAAGQQGDFTYDGRLGGAQRSNWVSKTWTFTAASSATTLQFESRDTTGGLCGPVIANVNVVALSADPPAAMSRDARRRADLKTIYVALKAYYKDHGYLPTSQSFGGADPGGWNYSSESPFLPFLHSSKYLRKVPKDPVNNGTDDVFYGGRGFSYAYYCYASENSLSLGAKLDSGNLYWIANHTKGFACK